MAYDPFADGIDWDTDEGWVYEEDADGNLVGYNPHYDPDWGKSGYQRYDPEAVGAGWANVRDTAQGARLYDSPKVSAQDKSLKARADAWLTDQGADIENLSDFDKFAAYDAVQRGAHAKNYRAKRGFGDSFLGKALSFAAPIAASFTPLGPVAGGAVGGGLGGLIRGNGNILSGLKGAALGGAGGYAASKFFPGLYGKGGGFTNADAFGGSANDVFGGVGSDVYNPFSGTGSPLGSPDNWLSSASTNLGAGARNLFGNMPLSSGFGNLASNPAMNDAFGQIYGIGGDGSGAGQYGGVGGSSNFDWRDAAGIAKNFLGGSPGGIAGAAGAAGSNAVGNFSPLDAEQVQGSGMFGSPNAAIAAAGGQQGAQGGPGGYKASGGPSGVMQPEPGRIPGYQRRPFGNFLAR